ncbi:Rqc2 family fibronectin-binding protein [Bombilactobacillus thymidiniphilus]|uniref:Rqc2 homolog RqcH n=1 Tax=Bombilactobacillus thymidiniphilus TaxID=2923363 RepID=A0ABY4PDI8_9LACO|nr:NFACT RNA binding domain-containing protein [Bombilactobacillus thymidiniphilus]UQS83581.1 NFACT family protein [Bombilactobacillus thymidiniphilus]
MSFDGVFIHALQHELQQTLVGGRISKIQQPFAQEVLLTIRNHHEKYNLLLSANSTYPRIQITQIKTINPPTPANFLIALRKNLDSAVIKQIYQIENDRILVLELVSRNELGDLQTFLLYVEIMSRHSNIILVKKDQNIIVDAIKHIDESQNRYRELLSKVKYCLPPQPDKVNPFDSFERERFVKFHVNQINIMSTAERAIFIRQYFMGLSKESAQELSFRLNGATDYNAILYIVNTFFTAFNTPQPMIYTRQNQQIFTAIAYHSLVSAGYKEQSFSNFASMLDNFYQQSAHQERLRQKASTIIQIAKRYIKRSQTKIKRLNKDLDKTKDAEKYRIEGELLTAYLSRVDRGLNSIKLPNYYDNNNLLEIKLHPDLSPSKNAQKYFKTYQKLKNSTKHLQEQLQLATTELNYFQGLLAQLDYVRLDDLAEIILELQQQGYLKNKNTKKKKVKTRPGELFVASDGTNIRVGKNNLQNDYITNKLADKRYTWLHIKNLPGSHVIIESLNPSHETLLQAAQLAAYFSKVGAQGTKVPIDYTLVKHVHKPNSAKPGFVIYTDQKTLLVDAKLLPTKSKNTRN